MISGERVRFAREFRGLTQTDLARQIGVTQPAIAQIEGGFKQPSNAVLEALALKTGFPMAFFRQSPPPSFPLGSLLFRSRAAFTSRERSRVYRYGQLGYELVERLLAPRVKGPAVRLPRLERVSIKEAANLTRDALGLPQDQPIANLTDAAERAGVLVIMLPTSIEKGDAFSAWTEMQEQTPMIAIGAGTPGDHARMSMAHELAELVLHHSIRGRLDEMERDANRFAAELLMPEEAIRQEIIPPVTLTRIARLKPRWGVSMQALVRRAYGLEIITRRQYTYLFEQIGGMGWRLKEPENLNIPVEKARGLRKMIEVLYGNPPNYARLATDARLTVHIVRKFVEAQAAWPSEQSTDSDQSDAPPTVISIESRRKVH
jgi:Zn-dependent peptidase ImmA (M78 family)/transcriptional regulator with XRE-family HTH domain